MTQWPLAEAAGGHWVGLGESLRVAFQGAPGEGTLDALTGATPLDYVRVNLGAGLTLGEMQQNPLFGVLGGTGWEWVTGGFLLGGLWLLLRRVITWHIPAAMLGAIGLLALVFHGIDPDRYAGPLFHLFSGGALLGAFFIATDPVTAATTPRGRVVFGAGIGVLTYVIRTWGGYPDAVAFSVLLMNIAAPTIDHYTRPRVFGERTR
jgi:electron transport complex protein RnfD